MTRTLDRKEKKAIRLKIGKLLDSDNPDYEEIKRLGELLDPNGDSEHGNSNKQKQIKQRQESIDMAGLNGLTVEKYEELNAAGKSNSDIEREFDIKLGTLKWHMKKQFNYVLPRKNKPKTFKNKKKQVKQQEKQHQGLTIEVIEPVEPTISLVEYRRLNASFNEVNFKNHEQTEQIKELKDRIMQLEHFNKINLADIELYRTAEKEHEEKVNRLQQSIKEYQSRINQLYAATSEIEEENLELRTVLKRVL